ncbi:MAG: hypothetical protein JW944_10650 [Deltaproteobacteria bacterium]|nr:hypothetical protein [Deltaproteobacteria bacterium]
MELTPSQKDSLLKCCEARGFKVTFAEEKAIFEKCDFRLEFLYDELQGLFAQPVCPHLIREK